jgi:hypothetical protein
LRDTLTKHLDSNTDLDDLAAPGDVLQLDAIGLHPRQSRALSRKIGAVLIPSSGRTSQMANVIHTALVKVQRAAIGRLKNAALDKPGYGRL